jgi:uncharacterized protein YbjQ (UPF0145 family)
VSAADGELADLAIAALAADLPHERERRVFSTDFSVDEAILVKDAGWEPRRYVVGCSIYHVGWTFSTGTFGAGAGEITTVTQAMAAARRNAMHRLVVDSYAVGAEMIVGVRLAMHAARNHVQFTALGTAISPAGSPTGENRQRGNIATTDLSGQDFFLLDKAGYQPLGLVFGNCFYYVPPQWAATFGVRANVEVTAQSRALSDAREIAMKRLQDEALGLGAAGVVGVQVVERTHAVWSNAIEFLAVGTAVRPKRDASGRAGSHLSLDVQTVIDLEDDIVLTDPAALSGHGE